MDKPSGVGVVDKAVAIASAAATSPQTLADLVERTGLPRATVHRLATALEHHGLLARDADGRFGIGPAIALWAGSTDRLSLAAGPIVLALRDATRESAQVYRRAGRERLCIASAEPDSGLRDTVPAGSLLTMRAGSAAQVLCAWDGGPVPGAAFTEADLAGVRRRGWSQSVGQREPGVASISAPVRNVDGAVVAAVSISGPVERLARPAQAQIKALLAAARDLAAAVAG